MDRLTISGQVVDLFARRIFPAEVIIENGIISSVKEVAEAPARYILPGFVDAHVHVESSMLVPTEFARLAVVHGTVATVSDPHEIANVCGAEGVYYMIENAKAAGFKFFFGAPSCVPATFFETAGAHIDARGVEELLKHPDIWYLSEMMNYPGVLFDDSEVMAKITAAHKIGKPVDGHAPGLRGDDVIKYASAGISTDHECFTLEEALDKIAAGMNILIREGSAARNYEALSSLLKTHPEKVMFCSDDKHPDELVLHHINGLVKRSLARGYDLYDVLRAASVNPVLHYKLPVGLLRPNDPADFIVIDSFANMNILQTVIGGRLVAAEGKTLLPHIPAGAINVFNTKERTAKDFEIKAGNSNPTIRVIEAIEGQLVTNELQLQGKVNDGLLVSDVENDILKMAVINRYDEDAEVAVAFIKNFGLKRGAIASTVAHDCHNIIVVGVTNEEMAAAVNALVQCKGGISVADGNLIEVMPLPVGGIMSAGDGYEVAAQYAATDKKAKDLGTPMKAPFMTLSFMALLVIPALKLSDKGLFDGRKFKFTEVNIKQ